MTRRLLYHPAARAVMQLAVLVLVTLLLAQPTQHYFYASYDVELYQRYAVAALGTPPQLPAEYPPLSVALFALPQLTFPHHYLAGFALMAALAAWGVARVVDRLSGDGWRFICLIVLGGWGAFYGRYDIFVVLCTVLALAACLRQRWLLAQALLALGIALKLYPLVLMPLVLAWQWRETGRLPLRAAFGGALGLLLAVGSMWLVDPAQFVAVLRYHSARPIEIEALGASLVWLLGSASIDGSYGSINLVAPSSSAVILLFMALNVLLLLGVYAAALLGKLRPVAAWALTMLVFVGTSKVFSTQYLLWVLPFVVLALAQRTAKSTALHRLSVLWSVICGLTGVIYPLAIHLAKFQTALTGVVPLDELMLLITLRNGLWVIFCGCAAWLWLVRKPREVTQNPTKAQRTPRSAF